MKCAICESKDLVKFLSLGDQPPSNAFLKEEDIKKPEERYPLDVFYCQDCSLVQLGYAVDPEILFSDYVYLTSTNNSLIKNFSELIELAVKTFSLKNSDF